MEGRGWKTQGLVGCSERQDCVLVCRGEVMIPFGEGIGGGASGVVLARGGTGGLVAVEGDL